MDKMNVQIIAVSHILNCFT